MRISDWSSDVCSSDLVIDSRREMRSKPEAPYLRSAEKMRRLEQALFTLTAIQRDVFRLSSRDGLAYPEIAERLSISVDAVEMHLSMAMLHLDRKSTRLNSSH